MRKVTFNSRTFLCGGNKNRREQRPTWYWPQSTSDSQDISDTASANKLFDLAYLFTLLYAPSGWPGFRTFSHSSCRIRRCSANSASEMKPELIVPISTKYM